MLEAGIPGRPLDPRSATDHELDKLRATGAIDADMARLKAELGGETRGKALRRPEAASPPSVEPRAGSRLRPSAGDAPCHPTGRSAGNPARPSHGCRRHPRPRRRRPAEKNGAPAHKFTLKCLQSAMNSPRSSIDWSEINEDLQRSGMRSGGGEGSSGASRPGRSRRMRKSVVRERAFLKVAGEPVAPQSRRDCGAPRRDKSKNGSVLHEIDADGSGARALAAATSAMAADKEPGGDLRHGRQVRQILQRGGL